MRFRIAGLMLAVVAAGLGIALYQDVVRTRRRLEPLRLESKSRRIQGIASRGLNGARARAVGSRLLVAAVGDVFDARLKSSFVWEVRVCKPGTTRALFTRRFDESRIDVPIGEDRVVSLCDYVDPGLPPGEYDVSIHLLELDPVTASPLASTRPGGGLEGLGWGAAKVRLGGDAEAPR